METVLRAHIEAGRGLFRGVRYQASWDASPDVRNSRIDPPPHLYSSPSFREGFACLAPFDLSFDAWLYHPQIQEVTQLARAFPETSIILNHCGGPLGIGPYAKYRDEVFAQWKEAVATISLCPNVVAKLGGIAMDIGKKKLKKEIMNMVEENLKSQRPSRKRDFVDGVIHLIEPEELQTDKPQGPWSCRGTETWAMILACLTGNVGRIEALLERDPNLVRAEYWYTQPLHFAVREGHLDAVRVLLKEGADPGFVRNAGEDLVTVARDRLHEEVAIEIQQALNERAATTRAKGPTAPRTRRGSTPSSHRAALETKTNGHCTIDRVRNIRLIASARRAGDPRSRASRHIS